MRNKSNLITNFEMKSLSEIVMINIGKTPSRYNKTFWGKGYSWVSISDLKGDKYIFNTKEEITDYGVKSSGIKLVQKNNILFSFKLSIGKVSITGKDIYTNEAIASLVIKDKNMVDLEYLYFVLSEFDFTGSADRAVMGNTLNKAKLSDLKIPVPNLEIQKKIAVILDNADKIRRKNKIIIDKYNELIQSIFLETFGDPINNSKCWDIYNLDKISKKITDGTHHSPENTSIGDFKYITAKNIKKNGIDLSNITYISKETHKEIFKRCNPEYGDILYIKDGATTGISCINKLEENFSMLSSVALIKPNKDIINEYYLNELLNSEKLYSYIRSQMGGAAITRLTLEKIKKLPIIVPPIDLQRKFAIQVKLIEKQKLLAEESLKKSEELFDSLLVKGIFN